MGSGLLPRLFREIVFWAVQTGFWHGEPFTVPKHDFTVLKPDFTENTRQLGVLALISLLIARE